MKFTIDIKQYTELMRYYSPDGVTLDGKITLNRLAQDYGIKFSTMHLAGEGYVFEALDPKLYTMFVLRWL
jgi:hypothetical protein